MKTVSSILVSVIITSGLLMMKPNSHQIPTYPTVSDTVTADSLEWERPRFSERQKERHRMVKSGIEKQGISDPSVLEAMQYVPRHLFVPERYQEYAYQNRPLPIGYKPGGILVAPIGGSGETQFLTRVTKSQSGKVRFERELPVRFVPMTGEAQEQ